MTRANRAVSAKNTENPPAPSFAAPAVTTFVVGLAAADVVLLAALTLVAVRKPDSEPDPDPDLKPEP